MPPDLEGSATPALLEREDKPGEGTLLQRHLATMQRISDTLLVFGNSARLLVDGPATTGGCQAQPASRAAK